MINWDSFLINQIARRKVVLFLGAGVSMNSKNVAGKKPKGWTQFLQDVVSAPDFLAAADRKLILQLMKKQDYLMCCEIVKRKLGRAKFTSLMENEFLNPNYMKALIHEHIFKLDSRIILTPNFDKIYDSYAVSVDNGIKIKQYYDDDVASSFIGDNRVIIKTHGTIDTPDKLIFTKSEYANARIKHSLFYEILEALTLTHTFLFIGAGLNDPDIKLLLEDTFFKHKLVMPHYFLIPRRTLTIVEKEVIKETSNIHFIEYSPNDDHSELVNSLEDLVLQVDSQRAVLKDTTNW